MATVDDGKAMRFNQILHVTIAEHTNIAATWVFSLHTARSIRSQSVHPSGFDQFVPRTNYTHKRIWSFQHEVISTIAIPHI